MNRLNKSVAVNPKFSWVDWCLYEANEAGDSSSVAADRLNQHLRKCVNEWFTSKSDVRADMVEYMYKFDRLGALDSEPLAFLDQVLDEIYG